ncbi:MAG: hypothetical protein KatS3mg031_0163 [Chitinophagales bacterium]|nr:MAG: hypothetical protein KatS3mg031_0163 [Chitinophagales bacterium]
MLVLWLLLGSQAFAQLKADFSASVTQGCSPLVVCFTDLSTGSPTSWSWNFGNNNLSPDRNPCAIYIVPGTYTVSLTVSNSGGSDTKTVHAMITVFANPTANFTASKTTGCVPEAITFTDLSAPGDAPIVSWRWDFGDGNTSTAQNPTNLYTNPGTYTVVLVVRDANGCEHRKTLSNYITILPAPQVNFTAAPDFACSYPAAITFTSQVSGSQITGYLWDFGDGTTSTQQNPVHTYIAAGSYTVSLTVSNSGGCSDTKSKPDFLVIDHLQADFSVNRTSGCGSVNVSFTDQSVSSGTIVSWAWDFGDGATSSVKNTTHNYTSPGTYDVTLIVTNNKGCKDTIVYEDLITVYPRPTVNFTADKTSGCGIPFAVNFTETANGEVSWLWDFGDGTTSTQANPVHSYTAPGSYGVRLTVTSADGCTRTTFKPNYIRITNPTANFTADVTEGCVDLTVNFTDQSSSNAPVISWLWDFGDGTTSTLQNPSHTYTTDGVYSVSLTITNADGCIDSILKTNYIAAGDTPVVHFGSDRQHVCLGTAIQFFDSTNIAEEWLWDFGDGNTATDPNPTYTYSDTGSFNVTLIAFHHGCTDTLTRYDYVSIAPPSAGMEFIFNCENPYEVTIRDNSLGPNEWRWDFGDGDTSTLPDNVHTYASTGIYTVSLFVRDTMSGCVDSTTRQLRITDPQADFSGSPLSGCAPLIVYFNSSSVDADTYLWLFGNGDTSTQPDPIYVYDSTGIYDVTLIVTDIHGCTDTLVKPGYVTVYGATAWFAADTLTGCTPLKVHYSDSSYAYLGSIVSWNWEFGDGGTDTSQHPQRTYYQPGIYSVSLKVSDSNGCTDSTARADYVIPTYPAPLFYADDTVVCIGQQIQFMNLSVGTGMQFMWDFGDGSSSTDSLPVHAYQNEGSYTVSLRATDINGCDSTLIKPLYIRVVKPHAAFTVDSLFSSCPPLWVNFTDLTPASDSVVAWLYHFGDNQTSDLQHPTHVYTTADSFWAHLEVTDFNGCKDTFYFPDPIVVTGPRGTFDFIQNEVCVDVPVKFFSDAADTIIHIYDYGDGYLGITVGPDTLTHVYTYPGVFHPSLVMDDGHGCVIAIDHPDSIVTFGIWAGFTADVTHICRASAVQFTDTSHSVPPAISWFWDFGDGATSTLQNPIHYYGVPGKYDVTLIVTNAEGCTDTLIVSQYITVDPGPTADFITSDSNVCIPETIRFTDTSVSDSVIISWSWDFGDGSASVLQNPDHTYTTAGSFDVTLMIETVAGCRDTTVKTIVTHGPPVAEAGPGSTICAGDSAQLTGTGGLLYAWSPASTLSDSAAANPLAFPTVTTTYILTVYDSIGCSDTDSVTVMVHPLPVVSSSGNGICIGGAAPLQASGGVMYSWTPASSLDNPNIANPIATPDSTTTYTVEVTDSNGCINTASSTVRVFPLPDPEITASATVLCEGEWVQLHATGGVSYSWSPPTGLSNPFIADPVATPSNSTTYVVTVTDSNNCVNTDSITLTVNLLQVTFVSPDTALCMFESAQLAAGGGTSYQWYPATGLSCTTCPDPVATPLETTRYYVDITNAAGCVTTDSVLITVFPLPTVTVSSDTALCYDNTFQLQASGGVAYKWFPAASLSCEHCPNPVAAPQQTTTYHVEVTSDKGCINRDSVTMVIRQLEARANFSDTVACLPADISFTDLSSGDGIIISHHWSFGDGTTDSVANPVHRYTNAGVYPVTLTVQSSYGCVDSLTKNIIIHPLPPADAGPGAVICMGDTALLQASGGIAYQWSPLSSLSNANDASPLAFPVISTTYFVTVTDANGCVSMDSVFVRVNPLPVVTVTPGLTTCESVSTPLNASGGVSYNWSPGTYLNTTNIPNPIARPLSSITYTVEVTDSNGCRNFGSVSLQVNPLPYALVSPDTSICVGDSVRLFAAGGTTYNWFPDSTLSCKYCPEPIASPASTTTYQVNITNTYGCTVTKFVTVTIHPLPDIEVIADTFTCAGHGVQLYARGGAHYTWFPTTGLSDPLIAVPIAMPDSSTTYYVRAVSAMGCVNMDSVHVEVVRFFTGISVSDTTGCQPVQTQFNTIGYASEPITSWHWDFGDGKSSSLPAPVHVFGYPGNYYPKLVLTTQRGCMDSVSTAITVFPLPVADAGPDTAICFGESVQLQGAGGDYYNWSPAIGLSAIDVADPIAHPAITRAYELVVTNAYGCQDRDSVVITVNDLPVLTVSAGASLCYGDSVQLEASGGSIYTWSPADGLNRTDIPDPVARPERTTVYMVTAQTEFGCQATDSVIVAIRPLPDIQIKAADRICSGDSTRFDLSGAVEYEWYPSQGLSCSRCSSPIASPDSSLTYYVRMLDAYGCLWTDSVMLTVNPVAEVTTRNDITLCKGESVELTSEAQYASEFTWTPANGLDNPDILSPTASPDTTTTYIIMANNAHDCPAHDTVVITVIDRIHTVVSDPIRICLGDSVRLEARIEAEGINGSGLLWIPADLFSDPTAPVQVIRPHASAEYMVVAAGGLCRPDTQYVHVQVDMLPTVDAGEDVVVLPGTEVTFTATSPNHIIQYYWSPSQEMSCYDCQSASVRVEESGTYYVHVVDVNGCQAADSVKVRIIQTCEGDIWVPNAFTPNGDETNNIFRVRSTGLIELISFKVFDRWGNQVFATEDIREGWDGTYQNKLVNTDVYVWYVRASCPNGEIVDLKGNVTALR